ncbi:MAG: hypothetical protein Q8P05_03220 [Candidatus Diapherotrites archaeon]|nr:hypothetical protein [Candidatus Diapherotrites archaeon]MDZ4256142.1 hypothetical protein [archaeon]
MGTVAEFFREIVKSTHVFFQKVGAFVLLVFVLGMLAGGYIIAASLSPLWFLAFAVTIVVMWNDFGEGVAIFALILILFLFVPELLPPFSI